MPSSTVRFLGVSTESTFCGLSNSNTTPILTGTLHQFDVLNAQSQIVSDEPLSNDGTDAREGFYTVPKFVYTDENGNPTKRGSLSIDCYLTSENEDALSALLETRFDTEELEEAGTITTAPTAQNAEIGVSDTAGSSLFSTERGISYWFENGLIPNQYAIGLSVGDKYIQPKEYKIPSDGVVNPTKTCAIRIFGDGWAQDCLGCTLTGITLNCDAETRVVRASLSIDVAFVIDSSAINPVLTVDTKTSPLYSLAAKSIIGDVVGACLDEWSLSITFNGESYSCGNYSVGRGPWLASSMDCVFNASIAGISSISILRGYYKSGETFPVSIPFTGKNIMAGFVIPNACFNDGSVMTVDTSKGFLRTTVNISPSYSELCSISFTRGTEFED